MFLDALAPRPLLTPDWPALPNDPTVAGFADAIRALVDAQLPRGGRVHVLGQGFGGLVALELALGRRKLVESLTLIGAHAGPRTAVAPPPWVASALGDALSQPDEALPRALNRLLYTRDFPHPASLLPPDTVRAHFAAAATADTYARLPRIDRRTLLLHGSADVVVLPENGRTIADRIPEAEFQLLDGAGHCVVQERPGRVAALLRDFLSTDG